MELKRVVYEVVWVVVVGGEGWTSLKGGRPVAVAAMRGASYWLGRKPSLKHLLVNFTIFLSMFAGK